MDTRTAITELIHRSGLIMDRCDFKGYLDLCAPEYQYRITTYSPEIRKDMTWLEHDKAGMKSLFDNLHRHNSDKSPISRHINVCLVDIDDAAEEAEVTSTIQVFRTTLDGGETELFAVGKLYDKVAFGQGGPALRSRNVRLDTRLLGYGYHIPF
ncbi:Methanesulfonate monooxygenase, hydroxylase beta subunit [Methyloversatilis universalis FAM5]|uniref:Methanesulfonate monooxygenase, hydroxylase beta subunit n=1 Tax=Methyloversatilis universalis (strain ATCC BAA-1314 / DSM 25237 / JCM 13912 / CCUG 52030 / FAM5) TaxID=1000565 RepID=F5RBK6_METUF|nr:nuclear transport factor 2 family protein [Methyloversatilis universalis]EGK72028.1 Methanesulfonate monooxygenase, hydroxylase beta subunit [Methyloversatilis universalis FAM5]